VTTFDLTAFRGDVNAVVDAISAMDRSEIEDLTLHCVYRLSNHWDVTGSEVLAELRTWRCKMDGAQEAAKRAVMR